MKGRITLVLLFLIAIMTFSSMYQVNEIEHAILLRFGKPVGDPVNTAGLKFKMPFVDNVVKLDKRILEYDSEPKELTTKDKKTIIIDNYAKWKISDPLLYLKSVRTEAEAQKRLDDIVYSELRQVLGKYNLLEIISNKREEIIELSNKNSIKKLRDFGIELVDIRIKRVELPSENETNIYRRMETQRQEEAKRYRAEGQEKALEIISGADKEKTIELSKAYREAQIIRGEAEKEAARIYAEAYNSNIEFYKFMRTLETYEKILNDKGNSKLILTTDSELLKYLNE
jgi:membrane protease subunit HflC